MSLAQGSNIVRNGLIFYYDSFLNDRWFSKSYKGKPTINYAWNQNAVAQSSYTPYPNSGGTWNIKHPNAIRAYNKAGTDITGYINTGANSGDWQNMYHAVWEYDNVLKKPVVVMRNWDGSQWKAKNWSLGKSYSTMGLGYGDTYTISWLQWVDNISMSADTGLYGQNTSGTSGFHDGRSGGSGSGTSFNTKAETWQRVYKTYTVSSVNNLTAAKNCYMYGHNGGAGVIKIADVQIEVGLPSPFIAETSEATSTRSNTDTLVDLTGNSTITANSLTYNNDGTFKFNGTSDYMNAGSLSELNGSQSISFDAWVKVDNLATTDRKIICYKRDADTNANFQLRRGYNTDGLYYQWHNSAWQTFAIDNFFDNTSDWHHVTIVHNPSASTQVVCYKNGEQFTTYTGNSTAINWLAATLFIGYRTAAEYFDGNISNVKIYNRELAAAEVKQNFEATRGRYGI